MTKFKLEIELGSEMLAASDIAAALHGAAEKIIEQGTDRLYAATGPVKQVRDESGKTVGSWGVIGLKREPSTWPETAAKVLRQINDDRAARGEDPVTKSGLSR